ncbi:MAG: amidase [Acidimicrobiia bacterium]
MGTHTELSAMDATEQAHLVHHGTVSARELCEGALARIEAINGQLNAVIHDMSEAALERASGELSGPFAGVPMVIKDLDGFYAGAPWHGGNKLLKAMNYSPPVTSVIFERFERAGFVIVGKTNTPEFGLMPTAEPIAYGPSRNPWNTEHSTGGSSGGSAAAVASGMVAVGHAGDGGGSIRIPASACGLVGLKPSRGRVSLGAPEAESWAGLVARSAVTKSVRDTAAILDVLTGPSPGDPYTAPPPHRPYLKEVGAHVGRLRIGLRTNATADLVPTDPQCLAAVEEAAAVLESLGHDVEIATPAALDELGLVGFFSTIMNVNAANTIDGIAAIAGRALTSDDMEAGTWALAEAGRAVTGTAYVAALDELHAWCRRIAAFWTPKDEGGQGFDLLLTPTTAEPSPKIGDVHRPDDPEMSMLRGLPFAINAAPHNMTGAPAISLPFGTADTGVPMGIQMVADAFREDVLIRVASQLEEARPWAHHRPAVHA